MRRYLLGLMALVWASAAEAQEPPAEPDRAVAVSDLIGRTPAEVRARLADGTAGWPLQPAFQLASDEGLLAFVALNDLMLDPALAGRLARFRTQGDPVPWTPYVQCRSRVALGAGPWRSGGDTVLLFRDGRLEAALAPIPEPPVAIPPNLDRKAMLAFIRRPVTSAFLARYGDLPLADGTGFLSRWRHVRLAPSDRLAVACADAPPPAPPRPPGKREGLSASDMQGLSLLPFAVTLPGKNQQREAALARGPALLAALHVGQPLAAERFAAENKGVRLYPSAQPGYAVASLDLGGYRGRNLTNNNDAALIGLKDGRIVWISPPSSFGPNPALLCLDDKGVPNAPRPGCSGWGHFSP